MSEELTFEGNPLIVIASNRGPYSFTQEEDGSFSHRRGAGGLVTALAALVEQLDVLWIAAALSDGDRAWAEAQGDQVTNVDGINLRLLITDRDAYNQYYNQVANPLLWFIQHGMWDNVRNPVIGEDTWQAWQQGYTTINHQFAQTIAQSITSLLGDDSERPVIVMPQDYHLYLVSHYLREALGDRVQIQPFIHIPWPGPDGWRILPQEMRNTLIKSLLASDRIGFQTKRDAFNFVQTARFYVEDAHSRGARDAIHYDGRTIGAKAYPISVDVDKLNTLVDSPEVTLLKNQLISQIGDRKLILRADRVEPSKNILRGLEAYRYLLETHPEHHDNVTFVMLLAPSRMEVDEYQTYLRDLMAEAGMINARFSKNYWQPVTVELGGNYERVIAAMQIYDVLLVNPITDGMNLVAKEGAIINRRDGVIVLSEHAGAFEELGDDALAVSPFDVYSTAKAIHAALTMPRDERESRAERLKSAVQGADVRDWFTTQLRDALQAVSNHARKTSTSGTPDSSMSEDSMTTEGVSSDSTPSASE